MKLQEVLDKTIRFFKDKGLESARLDAELLFADALKLERIQLYLKFEQPLTEVELAKLRESVRRRVAGESVAHILGKKEFFGYSFEVTQDTLIPRPETESLVEGVIAWAKERSQVQMKILDLGSGTGCIGISLAKQIPNCEVLCVEKSAMAFEVLQRNIQNNDVGNKVQAVLLDLDDTKACLNKFSELGFEEVQIIVSNPPYIAEDDLEVQPEVKKFEPKMALFSGNDGYAQLESWSSGYSMLLSVDSIMMMEMGYTQGARIKDHFQSTQKFQVVKVVKDLSGKDRFVVGIRNLEAVAK